MSLPAGTRLGPYEILGLLGTGGMGEVYRAHDTDLKRDVAIKVLPDAVARDAERLTRFQREARVLASLNHPNIAHIHGLQRSDGTTALVMELVDGATLADRIARGPVPVDEALLIARQIAEALDAAHEKGIVHRDLKPANVKVREDGTVKVLDFGLAKMQAAEFTSESSTGLATSAGAILGTPAYMSPEQVSGATIDHRTDIFSHGILLYELATGVRPFRGQSPAELASSILRDEPAPANEIRPSLPAPLSRVIARCLEKSVVTRHQTMSDVAKALKDSTAPPASSMATAPSVAVLPFQSLSPDSGNDFFGEGLAEEILNALSQIDGLRVAARASSFSFKGRSSDLAEIGSKLKVRTVLDGSVRRSGNRVRVTVQLVEVASGFQVWSDRYDREMADIFDVQDEIARAIAEKLKVTLNAGQGGRLVKQATANVDAYDLYLRGRALLLKRGRYIFEAAECLRRAVDLDPKFAAAWSGLADAFTIRGFWGMATPGDTMPKALTAARRAVTLDPDLAEGQSALALALLLWERDYAAALAAFERCLALNPNYTQGRSWFGVFYLSLLCNRADDAIGEVRRAVEIDPLSGYTTGILAIVLFCGGRTAESLDVARRAVERDPDSILTHWVHQIAAQLSGLEEESVAAGLRAEAVSGGHSFPIGYAVVGHVTFGRIPEARAAQARLLDLAARKYVPASIRALVASMMGEQDRAMELVEEACDERDPVLLFMARAFPGFERVRDDPRFADIGRRLHLP